MQSILCYIAYFNEFITLKGVSCTILIFDKHYVPFVARRGVLYTPIVYVHLFEDIFNIPLRGAIKLTDKR